VSRRGIRILCIWLIVFGAIITQLFNIKIDAGNFVIFMIDTGVVIGKPDFDPGWDVSGNLRDPGPLSSLKVLPHLEQHPGSIFRWTFILPWWMVAIVIGAAFTLIWQGTRRRRECPGFPLDTVQIPNKP